MTIPTIDPTLTVNEILLRHPRAVSVISAYGIDSCCGGGISLENVARKHVLDLDALIAALETTILEEAR